MVCVAAVALGSSTYAWFVSNNSVTGTTTNIAAQSNSAYLVIDKTTTSKTSTNATSYQTAAGVKEALYPAQVIANGVWQSAYGTKPGEATEQDTTRFTIKSTGKDDGSAAAAVAEKYAITDKFYIGTGTYDGEFSNLVVSDLSLTAPTAEIANAMRVLAKCGDKWQVWKYDATQGKGVQVTSYKTTATDEVALSGQATNIADSVSKNNDVEVDVYVYYDGADAKVMKREYKEWGINLKAEVVTFTEFLAELIRNHKLAVKKTDIAVTPQDSPVLARDLEETKPIREILSACGRVNEMLLNREHTMLAGNLIMNEYMPQVMEKVAQNRWINAQNAHAEVLVTESTAEYILLKQTKPEGIELLTVEEVVEKCL